MTTESVSVVSPESISYFERQRRYAPAVLGVEQGGEGAGGTDGGVASGCSRILCAATYIFPRYRC